LNFKQVLHWMRHNPIAVGSAVICLVAIVFLLIVRSKGQDLVQQAQNRTQMIKRIESFNSTTMSLPPEKVDGMPMVHYGAVNDAAIKSLQSTYSKMNEDYKKILELAERHNRGDANRGRHLPFFDGLFPDPGNRTYLIYDAIDPYQRAFTNMLGPSVEGEPYRLNAGGPVDRAVIDETASTAERSYRARTNIGSTETPTPNQLAQMAQEKQRAVLDAIHQQARSIHIYATRESFQIDPWPSNIATSTPKIEDIWESQLNLWIQQDIVQTIARTNRVTNPEYNVIVAPIKRLNKIDIVPGYVGINTGGGITSHGAYGAPASGDSTLPDNFSVSPTGRLSNTIYDIRHVWVDMDVDIQQLPVFMDELVQTNFMSVLKVEMTDVNEYTLLSEGFFYGTADVVRIRMLIETLWLRSWTVQYMPKAVKELIGVPETAPGSQASAR